MLRNVLSIVLSILLVFSAVPLVSAAGAAAGQIDGTALTKSGQRLGTQLARVRSLDTGHVAGVTTTNGSGEFSFNSLSAGSYIVELVSSGYVVGTSAPLVLSARDMTAEGVTVTAGSAAQAQAGILAGSFWTSMIGIITIAAITAGVITAVVVTKDDASPSR